MSLYSQFVKNVTHPLINLREGRGGIRRYLKDFEKNQYLPYDTLAGLQFTWLKNLLSHAYKNTSFYKKRFDSIGIDPFELKSVDDISNIPILTKLDIRDNLNALKASNFSDKEFFSSETGGTTGVKIKFFLDKNCLAQKEAATIRHERWLGWDIGDRVGLVWPARQDYVGAYTWKAKLKNALCDRYITLPAAVLTEEGIRSYCNLLKKLQPTKIRCFPYPLFLVAKFIVENRIKGIQPKGIVATGEPLYEHQRQCIEKAFGCRVFDSYGSRETGLIAQECEMHDGLHINADSVIIEILDNKGAPVGKGEIGRIVVTDLLNYGMPLIRYDIGDLGIFTEDKCQCGRTLPLLKGIEGREVDEIVLKSGKLISPITLVLYLVDNGPPVGQVQIVQDGIDHITIRFTADPYPGEEIFDFYKKESAKLLGEDMRVSFEVVNEIPREPSGKYRFVKSVLSK